MHEIALTALPLWKRFAEKASTAQQANVTWLVEHAEALLVLIRDTFPTYTRHDKVHSNNVVRLMGELLGPAIDRLTALEAAVLILSAYYHDIGMVFTHAERDVLGNDRDFAAFKARNPDVVVSLQKQDGRISDDIAERFCRWIHHERVALFLRDIEADDKTAGRLKWGGGKSIKNVLCDVCRSHGHDIKTLNDDEMFKTDFRAEVGDDSEADLRFCAILLRLADILDFDNTRAPEEIYRYLGLERRESPRTSASDVEWLKHLAALGFKFPRTRHGRYAIDFVAEPDHPAVEHDLREFLDIIEREMNKGASMLAKCSPRWRDLQLPSEITRSHIDSNGYKFGDYRFQLEQHQILDLLMGENLYENPFVFVRELLQNAIDTTRHRQFFEEENEASGRYKPGITVSQWRDTDNYHWVRIDDNGMGMSEEIIANYLLKVGRSYYSSAEFEAEKIGYRKAIHRDFTPISRFGIGLLSCFIAGDRVEISTRAARNPDAIRLSLSGLHGFYTLQLESARHDLPKEMPGRTAQERRGYRTEAGTTVAVRLDPARLDARFDLKALLEKAVLCSPVPIVFEGKFIGGDPATIVGKPWIDGSTLEPLTTEERREIEQLRGSQFSETPRILLVPLDLTKHSPTPDFKGQLLAFSIVGDSLEGLYLKFDMGRLFLEARAVKESTDPSRDVDWHRSHPDDVRGIMLDLTRILEKHPSIARNMQEVGPERAHPRWLSHNGILVPTRLSDFERLSLTNFVELKTPQRRRLPSSHGCIVGTIALADSLRPDISLSRDQFRRLSWQIYSTGNLALYRALGQHLDESRPEKRLSVVTIPELFGGPSLDTEELLLGKIMKDPYLQLDGGWASQPIIETTRGVVSLRTLRERLKLQQETSTPLPALHVHRVRINRFLRAGFDTCCALALLQLGVSLKLVGSGHRGRLIPTGDTPVIEPGEYLFPPLFFVPYADSRALVTSEHPFNKKHPFSAWLIEHAQRLYDRYPSMFQSIRGELLEFSGYLNGEPAKTLNGALDRLRELDPEIGPPAGLTLQASDFR